MPKVIVNHTGLCDGHYYQAGVEVELPEAVIAALGDSAKAVEEKAEETEEKEQPKAKSKKETKPEEKQPETKEPEKTQE